MIGQNEQSVNDLDVFFYYGEPGSDLDLEIQSDVLAGLVQPRRSLYYNRSDGAGVMEKENFPIALSTIITMRYDIMTWLARRNSEVSDGSEGRPDRRAASSQNAIIINKDPRGYVKMKLFYLAFKDYENLKELTVPLVRGES